MREFCDPLKPGSFIARLYKKWTTSRTLCCAERCAAGCWRRCGGIRAYIHCRWRGGFCCIWHWQPYMHMREDSASVSPCVSASKLSLMCIASVMRIIFGGNLLE